MHAQLDNCGSCGAPLPHAANFCPTCGTSVATGATARETVPTHETTPAPVAVRQTTPRWFGVTPPTLLLVLALVALVVAIVLLVTGSPVGGLLLLGLSLLLLAAFIEVARRKPDTVVVERATGAAGSLRARAGFAAQALRTRSSARRAIVRRRAEAIRLADERERLYRALGEAVYRSADDTAIREQIRALEAREAALEQEAAEIARHAEQEVARASRAVQPTEVRPPDGS